MKDYTEEIQSTNEPDLPFYERTELWKSILVPLLIIGYIIAIVSYGFFWLFKWLLFSWMRPFSNSKFFCKQGFHKYRKTREDEVNLYACYKCIICNKEIKKDMY